MEFVKKNFADIARLVLTLVLIALAIWWLVVVFANLDVFPKTENQQTIDTYQRAKDILLVVLPLVTTALGYWFGSAGKAKAEGEATKAQQQLTGVLASTSETDLLARARDLYPDAFSNNS